MDWRNSPRDEFLRRCRDLAGDEVIDNIIWRYEGIWYDVGPRSRDAAIDGIRHRYEEASDDPYRYHGLKVYWKDETERRRWFGGSQPETAMRQMGIALARILPVKKREYLDKCYVCNSGTYYYMETDTDSYVPICMNCYTIHSR